MPLTSENTFDCPWPVEGVECPRCQRQMPLTRVKQVKPAYHLHLFECAACGVAQVLGLDQGSSDPRAAKWVLVGMRLSR
jgi:hypothetical protein